MVRLIKHRVWCAAGIGFSLLFIIYINDIIKACSDKCNIKMFADDTLIYVSGDGSEELQHKMNRVFLIIEQ